MHDHTDARIQIRSGSILTPAEIKKLPHLSLIVKTVSACHSRYNADRTVRVTFVDPEDFLAALRALRAAYSKKYDAAYGTNGPEFATSLTTYAGYGDGLSFVEETARCTRDAEVPEALAGLIAKARLVADNQQAWYDARERGRLRRLREQAEALAAKLAGLTGEALIEALIAEKCVRAY